MSPEFDLIRRHFVRPMLHTQVGPGDDCALIRSSSGCELAVTSDMLVSGTHFLPGTDPHRLGWKSLAVNLSDLAAMGATPRWVTLALSLPQADDGWLSSFAAGFYRARRQFRLTEKARVPGLEQVIAGRHVGDHG